jgi:hypothetical protein
MRYDTLRYLDLLKAWSSKAFWGPEKVYNMGYTHLAYSFCNTTSV